MNKKSVGTILLIVGALGIIYGLAQKMSIANQLADAFGVKNNTPIIIIVLGAIAAIVGLVLTLSKETTKNSNT